MSDSDYDYRHPRFGAVTLVKPAEVGGMVHLYALDSSASSVLIYGSAEWARQTADDLLRAANQIDRGDFDLTAEVRAAMVPGARKIDVAKAVRDRASSFGVWGTSVTLAKIVDTYDSLSGS